MNSPFYTSLNSFRNLTTNCYFAKKLCNDLLTSDMISNNEFSLDLLKESLKPVLENTPLLPTSYFQKYCNRYFYEVIFSLYNMVHTEQILDSGKTRTIRECIKNYTDNLSSRETLEQEISRKKTALINDYSINKYHCTYQDKLNTFYNYMGISLLDNGNSTSPCLTPQNIIIAFTSYSNMIFNSKGQKKE